MTVSIIKVDNAKHAVVEEGSEEILYECGTQQEAIEWATDRGYTINIHRERNRTEFNRHGQFRQQ